MGQERSVICRNGGSGLADKQGKDSFDLPGFKRKGKWQMGKETLLAR